MLQFFVFSLSGFLGCWWLLLLWGFTARPVNAAPYFGLISNLALLLVAAPAALFIPRVASAIGVFSAACILLLPLFFRFSGGDISAWLLALGPPFIVVVVGALTLWKTRTQTWVSPTRSPQLVVRVSWRLFP